MGNMWRLPGAERGGESERGGAENIPVRPPQLPPHRGPLPAAPTCAHTGPGTPGGRWAPEEGSGGAAGGPRGVRTGRGRSPGAGSVLRLSRAACPPRGARAGLRCRGAHTGMDTQNAADECPGTPHSPVGTPRAVPQCLPKHPQLRAPRAQRGTVGSGLGEGGAPRHPPTARSSPGVACAAGTSSRRPLWKNSRLFPSCLPPLRQLPGRTSSLGRDETGLSSTYFPAPHSPGCNFTPSARISAVPALRPKAAGEPGKGGDADGLTGLNSLSLPC